MWIGISFSTIPPGSLFPGFWCFLTLLTSDTIALFNFGRSLIILPFFPLSLPASTITSSPFFIAFSPSFAEVSVLNAMRLAEEPEFTVRANLTPRNSVNLFSNFAFHSPVVSSAKKEVEKVIEQIELRDGQFSVYMNIDANIAELSTIKERLVNQIDNSVMFYNQILNIEKFEQPETWYHIGPGNVTAGMVKKSISSKSVKVVNSLDSLNDI